MSSGLFIHTFIRFDNIAYGLLFDQSPPAATINKIIAVLSCTHPSLKYPSLKSNTPQDHLTGNFVGPPVTMPSPWCSCALDIFSTIGVQHLQRIERYIVANAVQDPLLETLYTTLDQKALLMPPSKQSPQNAITFIQDTTAYNKQAALKLTKQERTALSNQAQALGRLLSNAEWFGLAQFYSEHCRHKIFNSPFILNNQPQSRTLFDWIKATTQTHSGAVVSAYTDNVAFFQGPSFLQFDTNNTHVYQTQPCDSVLSLKAETHNFPTTVEPFYGAGTGTGGEIRDRLAGGQGSIPLGGTAVYMTAYTRLTAQDKAWEKPLPARKWLYNSPSDTLIKASDGASDYANKYGQPLITGTVFTFEQPPCTTDPKTLAYGYDKVVMLAGGVGWGKKAYAHKPPPQVGDHIVIIGGDNYRIGLGGSAISSDQTGQGTNTLEQALERHAVQRANPEMQCRIAQVMRRCLNAPSNPIRSVHDHGAGGHMNCIIELLEEKGGTIDMAKLPIGDKTLTPQEVLSNESQERMGLLIIPSELATFQAICQQEQLPCYVVGKVDTSKRIRFVLPKDQQTAENKYAVDLPMAFFDQALPLPTVVVETAARSLQAALPDDTKIVQYLQAIFALESVACKSWLVRKVDRCVGGLVAKQPTCGPLQLPLNNVGVLALDFTSDQGVATSLGHMAGLTLVDAAGAACVALVKALTNLVFASWSTGLAGVSCSANWMWHETDYAGLYTAVQAISQYAQQLGINIPTGKDSLFMGQQYPDGSQVVAPGTVVVSAATAVDQLNRVVEPVLQIAPTNTDINPNSKDPNPKDPNPKDPNPKDTVILWLPLGSTHGLAGSAWAQTHSCLGGTVPALLPAKVVGETLGAIQELIRRGWVLAGHDVSSGGLITTLFEMCFATVGAGLELDFSKMASGALLGETCTLTEVLFSESPGVVLQVRQEARAYLEDLDVSYYCLGKPSSSSSAMLRVRCHELQFEWLIEDYRAQWYQPARLLDALQTPAELVELQADQLAKQPLSYTFPLCFDGTRLLRPAVMGRRIKAGVLRAPGTNSAREMAYALHAVGFEVVDVPLFALISGEMNLDDLHFVAFAGGFAHADVLGAAQGWAAAFRYNVKARRSLERFMKRSDVLSLGACNGCQLMIALGLLGDDLLDPNLLKSGGIDFSSSLATQPQLLSNVSDRFECHFVNIDILDSPAIIFKSLVGARLGVWAAHAAGRFVLPTDCPNYQVAQYSYKTYPGNPNGSDQAIAALCNKDGRHVAIMPHIERALFPYNWAYYPKERLSKDAVSPWMGLFTTAYEWLLAN